MAHPGGNVTGLSIQQTALAAKKLELLREAVRLPPYSSRTVPGGPQGRVRRSRAGHCKRVTETSKRKRSPPLWRAHTPRVERVRVLRPPRFLMDTAHV
jgi:hypothetical protein